jgi:RHS repeat-associated protein
VRPVDTPRGFTGHEHLDAVGIIHMNGRIYDPALGRMLSPDPNVPDPTVTQSFNRYAYVRNNPLSYTDPTGFWEDGGDYGPGRDFGGESYPDGSSVGEGQHGPMMDRVPSSSQNSFGQIRNKEAVPNQNETLGFHAIELREYLDSSLLRQESFVAGVRNWFTKVDEDIEKAIRSSERDPWDTVDRISNSFPQASFAKWPEFAKSLMVVGAVVTKPKVVEKSVEALTKIAGRSGRQAKLRELATDPKLGRADKGWINQEINSINRGQRKSIRNPPGKDLAHERGRESAKGYGYEYSNLQERNLHRLQHKYDNFGRKNK